MIGIRSAISIKARGHRPHLEAVYMTAPRSVCRNTKKVLAERGPSIHDGGRETRLRALLLAHQIGEPLEQIVRIPRTGRGFRVILHRKYRLALELDAAIGAVEQRDVRLRRARRQRRLVDGKAV